MSEVEKLSTTETEDDDQQDKIEALPTHLLRDKHIKFFKQMLNLLPEAYQSHDSSRLTLLYFSLSALDLLGAIDNISEKRRKEMISWIYSLQVKPDSTTGYSRCGFYATDSLPQSVEANYGHIAMTYVALCSLIILGDDLSGIDRNAAINGLKALQLDSGSYQCISFGTESDARFVYCAACISFFLNDWRGMDIEKATEFILSIQSYEGGFAQNVGREAHGGSTFCALAALELMGQLDSLSVERKDSLVSWCINRQQSGFNGRPNKPTDTCYSFWLGASLTLLGAQEFINKECNFSFLMTTQDRYMGGFSKWPKYLPDPLHSYFGIAGMFVISGEVEINPALNISMRAYRHWQSACSNSS